MTDLKRSLDRALSGVEFRPENRQRVLLAAKAERWRPKRAMPPSRKAAKEDSGTLEAFKPRRRVSAVLLIVLIAVLILVAAAVAAVVSRGFGWYASQTEDPAFQSNMKQLDQLSEADIGKMEMFVENTDDELRFEVSRGYYDGEQAAVTYALYVPSDTYDTSWRPSAAEMTEMVKNDRVRSVWDGHAGMYEALQRDYNAEGACGVHLREYGFSDRVSLADGPDVDWREGNEPWGDGYINGYRRFEKLPKAARNQQKIEFIFYAIEFDTYYYKDATGIYFSMKHRRNIALGPVVIPRGKGKTVYIETSGEFEHYKAWANASVSPVGIQTTVWLKQPDEWVVADAWSRQSELSGIDYILKYLLFADGVSRADIASSEGIGNEGIIGSNERSEVLEASTHGNLYEFTTTYQGIEDGTKEIRLRPVYSISGERPEEDLVLRILQ